ncbi:hypothetical protein GCM10027047_14310 [Rhodococcus aerolatus]
MTPAVTGLLLGGLVGLPAAVGVGLLALPAVAPRVGERAAAPVGVATAAAVTVLAALAALARPRGQVPLLPGQPLLLTVDALAAAMVLTVAVAALAVLVFVAGSPEEGRRRLVGLLLVFTAAMLLTVTAATLLTLLMAWELMGAASYALIGHQWRERRRVAAGDTAFLVTRTADVGLYVAAGAALAAGVGGLSLAQLNQAGGTGWVQVVAGGVVLAAVGKSAQLPFSGWLSGAMLGPSPVSALLHSATMVAAGAYLLLRMHPLLEATGWALPVAWVGAVTGVVMGAVALVQHDLKQLLAASTCAQVGFMVLAAGTGAITGGVAALVAHAATKALLFLAAGAWLDALGTKDLTALRGVGRRYPGVGAAAVVGALSLAGVPPLALWVGKDAALAGTAEAHPVLYAVGLLAAALSAAYGARVLAVVLAPTPDGAGDTGAGDTEPAGFDAERQGTRTVSALVVGSLVGLAVLAAGLGLLELTPAAEVLGGPPATVVELLTSAALVLVVVTGVVVADRRGVRFGAPGWLTGWVGATAVLRGVGVGVTRLAEGLAAVDDRGVAGVVDALARGTRRLATLADERAEPVALGAATATASGARRLGALARRPQTGQLHTYYAQAVAALVVLAVLIVLVP